jgi:hypothetical protein
MFSLPLHLPSNASEFLSTNSPLNPHFFAYGSLPLYLLKVVGSTLSIFYPPAVNYDQINLVGRFISAIFDVGTLIVVFLLGRKLFSKTAGLITAFLYGISVLPIQLSHFYAVDTILTFFILSTLYQSIGLYEKPTVGRSIFVGFFFGLSLATKISGLALLSAIGAVLIVDFLLMFIKSPHRPHIWLPHVPKFIKNLFIDGFIILIVSAITFVIFEPYAILDFKTFWANNMQQQQMTYNAFTFPYTLQYVGKIPYIYELKNIFFWGQGPIIASISFLGIFYALFIVIKKKKEKKWAQELILIIFLLSYFAIVGHFAIGFMRYMLPLYPIFCLFGAVSIIKLGQIIKAKIKSHIILNTLYLIFFASLLVWPLSFMHIYTQPNTRVLASEWINKNISVGAKIAIEHWDDGLPLGTQSNYRVSVLPIYDMQNPVINAQIYQSVKESEYLIIASNRLHVPLQRIAKNCQKWNIPQERCPSNADQYYEDLFSGKLGFRKIAEFATYPTLPIFNIQINDQSSDENFTVFDHPKIMIFKKQT